MRRFALLGLTFGLVQCGPVLDTRQQGREVIEPIAPGPPQGIPEGLCILPPSLDFSGIATMVEECPTLFRFEDSPPTLYTYRGSSVVVCCPDPPPTPRPPHKVCFPDEPCHPDYEYPDDYPDGPPEGFPGGPPDGLPADYSDGPPPPFADSSPSEALGCPDDQPCQTIDQCEQDALEPSNSVCGWDNGAKATKVCCKKGKRPFQLSKSSPKYQCEDLDVNCPNWASKFPESCSDFDHPSFSFMTAACRKSCGTCGNRGCQDDLPKCDQWTKDSNCVVWPAFMGFHCRASCGVCGFRSVTNREEQVVNGRGYSEYTKSNFFCGEGKPKEEINSSRRRKRSPQGGSSQVDPEVEVFYYNTEAGESNRGIRCGSTLINDRFILFAAHCHTQFQTTLGSHEANRQIIIRDDTKYIEHVEIKRVFSHPLFKFPNLYHDIAIGQLGRRILYDYDTFGDSPTCLSDGKNIDGEIGVTQGYGFTEFDRTSDVLLETNVTIIDNVQCAEWLRSNTSFLLNTKASLKRTLPRGINDQLVCSVGIQNEETGIFSGPCVGDSGGPLYVNYGQGGTRKQTLEGIVSGGLSCGLKNFPAWYTRVSSYRNWIDCIVREAIAENNQKVVEKKCQDFVQDFGPRNIII